MPLSKSVVFFSCVTVTFHQKLSVCKYIVYILQDLYINFKTNFGQE